MKRKMMAKVLMLLGTFGAGSTQAAVFHFDFDDADAVNTAAGYTSVTRNSIYSGGVGWGLVELDSGTGSGFGDNNQPAGTVTGGDLRYSDAVEFRDAGDNFRVDLPNGDYYVTVAVGVPGWNSWNKVNIQGVDYRWNSATVANITAPSPDNGTIKISDPKNGTMVAPVIPDDTGSFDQFRLEGYNNTGGAKSEFLLIQDAVVTVTNGYLTITPTATGGNRWIAFADIESVPEPASLSLLGLGALALRRRK